MKWTLNGRLWPYLLLVCTALPGAAAAQPGRAGDGLKAEYYSGASFDELVLTRRDTTIGFNWAHRPPVPGLPAEYFSVRWTGWLVPPVSGPYVLHATVDDGMRIWLNDRLILDEWGPQPVARPSTSVELRAGEPYRLRVEYYQEILDTRAVLTWQPPAAASSPAPPSSWRNLWGLTKSTPAPAPTYIPTRYLFSVNPRLALPAPAAPRRPPARATPPPPAKPRPASAQRGPSRPAAVRPAPPAAPRKPPAPAIAPDSGQQMRLAGLAVGAVVTLPELYFQQGSAVLPSQASTSLNSLAEALHARPSLRFEVQGHTDNIGDPELNRRLSQQRAEAVCQYLTMHGVAATQLRPVGYGGTQPVADNASAAERPKNRRVVLRRLSFTGQ